MATLAHDWSTYAADYRGSSPLPALVRHWQYHAPAHSRLCRRLGPGARILDVGCGAGASALLLSAQGYQADGVDAEPTVIELARDLAARLGSSATFRVADASSLPYGDDAFDASFSMGVLEHFDDGRFVAALREQGRVAPLVMTVLPTRRTGLRNTIIDERFFAPRELRRLHRRAGLRVVSLFGYGSLAGAGGWHRLLHLVLPAGASLILERKFGYALQAAALAVRD